MNELRSVSGAVYRRHPKQEKIQSLLKTRYLGHSVLYTESTGSTNEDAKGFAYTFPDGFPEGALLVARTQTSGKGRIGRTWSSPPGGLFLSLLLKPKIPPSKTTALSLVAGYCVATALRQDFQVDAKVKWPNDVLVNGKKVSGILCEMRTCGAEVADVVVGVGINANVEMSALHASAQERGTSLLELLGESVDEEVLLSGFLNHFEPVYVDFLANGFGTLGPKIVGLCAYLGEEVTVGYKTAGDATAINGRLLGFDDQGRLLLELKDGKKLSISAGDLSLRPASTLS